ncbi:MAG TPA: PGF-pre-PGF domain-containing protein [Candidatus Sabulitectum sp.]|nr:PGF-pre-PGF domain-containing protein [Candidatus Sabulitectum sp.]HPJ28519.1 PGF-pre-PGF domain-containing protein [Candidatus Sabulitectum sp.]HPR22245.1 PGF-pre-PGF domain-containing protein [Candidatus Sabulitectum sp.]
MRGAMKTIFLVLMISATAAGSVLDPGARAMGMAGAFIPLADDGWACWWNPAGLLRSGRIMFGAEYTSLYPNMDLNTIDLGAVGYVQPITRFAAFGLGAGFLSASDQCTQGEGLLAFAFRPGIFPVSFGLAGGYHFREYADNEFTSYDPLFAGGLRAKGISLDAGFQAELGRRVTFAGVARNILQPDMGIGEEDPEPMEVSLGFAFYPRFITPVIQADWSLEEVNGDTDIDIALGLEKWIGEGENWGFRTGFRTMALGAASEVTAGVSARYEGTIPLSFDYSFALPLNDLQSTWGRHRAGLTFRLGGSQWVDEEPRVPLPPMVDRRTWQTGTDLSEVSLWAGRDVQNDSLTVAQYDQIPLNSTLRLDQGQVLYAYFPARATFTEEDIRDLSASFRVPRYWFEQNNVELRLLRLFRVNPDNTLERMPSALVDEDEGYYYFEASLDRIDDFLITSRHAELVMVEPQTVYGDVDSVDIIEASLSFRVSKIWMDQNRIDPATLGLTRVRGGVPLDVRCTQVDEDLNYLYYETDPINLFQFMIVAREREGLSMSTIYFDHNVAEIRDDQYPDLDRIVQTLRNNPGVFVSVEGHADSDGTFGFNDGLSKDRALNVAEYLETQLAGYDIEIEPTWFGERRPAAANDDQAGRALNRRVEIVILRR